MISRLLSTLLFLLATSSLHAQPANDDIESAAGRTYVVAFPDTTTNTFDIRYPNSRHQDHAYMMIYSAVDNRVSIRGTGYNRTMLLPAGKFTVVDLMDPALRAPTPIVFQSNVVNNATFRLEADQPVIVHCYLLTRFGTEAWTPIPVESWGTEYFAAARPGELVRDVTVTDGVIEYEDKRKMAPSEITIVAAYDDTRVSISPNGALLNSPRIASVVLNAGQVYQVQSFVDTSVFADQQPDLGGSYVFATKPIGVISGNTRARALEGNSALAQNAFKNMLIEWLAPVEQHGTEFVYMPTWDARRPTGAPGEDVSSKRKGEHVRIYATRTGVTTGYSLDNTIGRTNFSIPSRGKFREDFIGTPQARYYRTDKPAQAMMNSTAVARYNGTNQGSGGLTGPQFDAWGGYMVEMTPREQWTGFAPFYAPAQPAGMEHFINVVVDSVHSDDVYMENGSRFQFNRGTIAGSGLIWGTMSIPPGRDYHLEGRNGAKFHGFVYGIYQGREQIFPTVPAYEEYLAVAYGYPLAPARQVIGTGDSLQITLDMACGQMTVVVAALNANPVGLKSIRLDSTINARISSITPDPLTGAPRATVVVTPIDIDRDASAVLIVSDRAGKITRIPYRYVASRVTVSPASRLLDFGTIAPRTSATREVVMTNTSADTITISSIDLLPEVTIDSIRPGMFPVRLAPGASIRFIVRVGLMQPNMSYFDSIGVKIGCVAEKIYLRGRTGDPRISVTDIDFGTLDTGAVATRNMTVCNVGNSMLFFLDGPGGELIEWLNHQQFTVSAAEIDRLRRAELDSGECVDIAVTFRSSAPGSFRDSARLYASVSADRSRSIWSGRAVAGTSGVVGESSIARSVTVRPNPVIGATVIGFRLERPQSVRLVVVDAGGREVSAHEQRFPAGESAITWDAYGLPAGVYFYRLIIGAEVASGAVIVVR